MTQPRPDQLLNVDPKTRDYIDAKVAELRLDLTTQLNKITEHLDSVQAALDLQSSNRAARTTKLEANAIPKTAALGRKRG